MTLGSRLQQLREARHMDRISFSKELGFAYTTYINYETGKREPSYMVLVKLAEYFDISLDYLLGRTEISYSFAKLSNQQAQIVLRILESNEEKQYKLIRIMNCFDEIIDS